MGLSSDDNTVERLNLAEVAACPLAGANAQRGEILRINQIDHEIPPSHDREVGKGPGFRLMINGLLPLGK